VPPGKGRPHHFPIVDALAETNRMSKVRSEVSRNPLTLITPRRRNLWVTDTLQWARR
jgi:hypothetical protein